MKPKLRSTVSVVKISDSIVEFFKTNTRQQLHIKVQDNSILDVVLAFDGETTVSDLSQKYDISEESIVKLVEYLRSKGIIDNVEDTLDLADYPKFRRTIHFISDYATSHSDLVQMWNNIYNSTVLIIGLGAVGSWVACNLAQSGVRRFILMDPDKVEASNLHRQFGYTENDIGINKVDVLAARIQEYDPNIKVVKQVSMLTESSLTIFDNAKIDIIINCADKPSVDMTSLWVGEYAMKNNIPHIIGGGYNLHLSLIGQTVLPGKSACVNCFRKKLEEENRIDPAKVKKLAVKNRKVGSFGPMCSLIASMVGMEAIKVLSQKIPPSNVNRRGEFDIYTMEIQYKEYCRRRDCEWCGQEGLYFNM